MDPVGHWGSAAAAFPASSELTAGVDYALEPDQPDGTADTLSVNNQPS